MVIMSFSFIIFHHIFVENQSLLNKFINYTYTVFPRIVSALEYFPPLNCFRTSMYCHQRSQYIRSPSKKYSFRGNYSRKYGILFIMSFSSIIFHQIFVENHSLLNKSINYKYNSFSYEWVI